VDSLFDACDFVRVMQQRQGLVIAALEEIAYRNGWIDCEQLLSAAQGYGKSSYGSHLRKVADNKILNLKRGV